MRLIYSVQSVSVRHTTYMGTLSFRTCDTYIAVDYQRVNAMK